MVDNVRHQFLDYVTAVRIIYLNVQLAAQKSVHE